MFVDEFFGGIFGIGIVFPLAFLAVVALAVVAVTTGRAEPDPEGRRAYGLYLSVVGVVAILVALFAATDSVGSVVAAIVEEDEEFSEIPAPEPFFDEGFGVEGAPPEEFFTDDFAVEDPFGDFDPDDERYASAVRSALLAAAALTVYGLHRRRIVAAEAESVGREGPAWRVHYGYLLSVALLGIVVFLAAAADSLYGVFRALAPGVSGFGDDDFERAAGISQFARSGILAAAAFGVYRIHWESGEAIATPPLTLPPGDLDGPPPGAGPGDEGPVGPSDPPGRPGGPAPANPPS